MLNFLKKIVSPPSPATEPLAAPTPLSLIHILRCR
ncbi:hypothetical protein, partial [Pseudomonas aeruginosa]